MRSSLAMSWASNESDAGANGMMMARAGGGGDVNEIAAKTSNALSSALRLRKAEFRARALQKKLDAAVAELARSERQRLRAERKAEDCRATAAASEARAKELRAMLDAHNARARPKAGKEALDEEEKAGKEKEKKKEGRVNLGATGLGDASEEGGTGLASAGNVTLDCAGRM